MMFLRSSLSRAGVLFLALAGIGSTGCITTAIVNNVQYQNRMREQEAAHQRRIAALEPAAAAGDAKARVALANELLDGPVRDKATLQRAVTLLTQAAGQDDPQAQSELGMMFAVAEVGRYGLVPSLLDRKRGIAMLKRAATQGCGAGPEATLKGLDPALKVARALDDAGQPEQARVWRARSVLDCRTSAPADLLWRATRGHAYPDRHAESLAILLLTRDGETIAKARATVPAEDFAAAERLAAELQQQVAASRRDFPAPPRKEHP
jgi:hypothetical protein